MAANLPSRTQQKLTPFKLASIYIGTVVGAGFASGQEVLQFFGFHGIYGIWGLLLSTTLFVVFGAISFILGYRLKSQSHLEVVRESAGLWVGTVVDAIITFFLLGAFTAMCAGSGAVFAEQFSLPSVWGSAAMAIISVVTVLFGIQGVLSAIGFVAPILVAAVLTVSIMAIIREPINWFWFQPQSAAVSLWPLSAIAYTSYNMVLAVAVLAPTGALASEVDLRKGALFGGLGLGLGALAIHLAILTQMPRAMSVEVPMLLLAQKTLGRFVAVYSIVLVAEVYTTAAGSLYGFVARFTDPKGNNFALYTVGAGFVGFLGSLVGFSELVNKLYSGVGYAGFVLLIALIVGYWKTGRTGGNTV